MYMQTLLRGIKEACADLTHQNRQPAVVLIMPDNTNRAGVQGESQSYPRVSENALRLALSALAELHKPQTGPAKVKSRLCPQPHMIECPGETAEQKIALYL